VGLDSLAAVLQHEAEGVHKALEAIRGFALWRVAQQLLQMDLAELDVFLASVGAVLLVACRTAVATLVEALGLCRQLFKAGVGEAEEYEKKAKALWALQAKRDAAYKEVGKLESKVAEDPKVEASLSKKRAELQELQE
jgi:hypothetical protein